MKRVSKISERIKQYRERMDWTLADMEEKTSCPAQTLNRYELGQRIPKIDTAIELAEKLSINPLWLQGYDVPCDFSESEDGQNLSSEENAHIQKYRLLDPYGKEAVGSVLDVESRRCEAARAATLKEQREQMEAGEMLEPEKVIRFRVPEYTLPLSAGTGAESMGEFPLDRELSKAPPRGTSYIAHVSGVSMEPTYHNEDIVFVHSCEEIPVGRIGVFLMDGKQWIKELGDGELISHNQEYDPIPMREDIRCQGLVLGVCDESYFE